MLHDFGIVIHAPLSVPPTMHIVISINSICSRFIRSDSFIPWNQKDPAALSLLTHSVSLVDFITTINLIETIYSIISMPSVQPFKSVLNFLFQFHWYYHCTNSNSFINSIDSINLTVFISSITTVPSLSFNFDSILDIINC